MIQSVVIKTDCNYGNRYVSHIVNEISLLKSEVVIEKLEGRTANAKSVIGVLSLGVKSGDEIYVYVINDNEDLLNRDLTKVKEILG